MAVVMAARAYKKPLAKRANRMRQSLFWPQNVVSSPRGRAFLGCVAPRRGKLEPRSLLSSSQDLPRRARIEGATQSAYRVPQACLLVPGCGKHLT